MPAGTVSTNGYTFGEIAKVKFRGTDVSLTGIPGAAWQVYKYIRSKAYDQDIDARRTIEGVEGILWRGDIKEPFRDLWPARQQIIKELSWEDGRRVVQEYLRTQGNVVNLQIGNTDRAENKISKANSYLSLWWVRLDYAGTVPGEEDENTETQENPAVIIPVMPVFPAGVTSDSIEQEQEEEGKEKEAKHSCREPDCVRDFKRQPDRNHHENAIHPDSEWRVYECPLAGGCPGSRFYTWAGLSIHMSQMHGFSRADPQHASIRKQIEKEAGERRQRLEIKRRVWTDKSAQEVPAPALPAPVQVANRQPEPAAAEPAQQDLPARDTSPFSMLITVLGNIRDEHEKLTAANTRMSAEITRLHEENAGLLEENGKLKQQLENTDGRVLSSLVAEELKKVISTVQGLTG